MNYKHQAFIDEYLKCFNATEAYFRVYHPKKRTTAGANGPKLLENTEIKAELERRIAENTMSADEALMLLTEHARGDPAKLMDVSSMGFNLDMQKAQEQGLTKLIKKVKQRTIIHQGKSESDEDREVHDLEIELYDAQAALDKILRVHGKYDDKRQHTGEIVIRYATDEDEK